MSRVVILQHSMKSAGTQVYRSTADALVDVYVAAAVSEGECINDTHEQNRGQATLRVSITDVPADIVIRLNGCDRVHCLIHALPLCTNDVVRIATTRASAHVAWCVPAHTPRPPLLQPLD